MARFMEFVVSIVEAADREDMMMLIGMLVIGLVSVGAAIAIAV